MTSASCGLGLALARGGTNERARLRPRSTQDQDLCAQLEALRKAGAATTYREKISGVRADRPQLKELMASLRSRDIVLITKIDRLADRHANCSI